MKDNKDARHIKTYEVSLKDKDFVEGPWSQTNLDNGAGLLIPVPMPLGGVIIIGEETIVYCSEKAYKAVPIRPVSIGVAKDSFILIVVPMLSLKCIFLFGVIFIIFESRPIWYDLAVNY